MDAIFGNIDNQYSKFLSLLWSKNKIKSSIWVVLMLIYLIPLCFWSKWPASTSISNTIASEQCSFSGYSSTITYNAVSGPVSNNMYYLHYISPPNNWAIRKSSLDGSTLWLAAFSFIPAIKSLAVDASERYAYIGSWTNPLDVIRLSTDTGSIVDTQR